MIELGCLDANVTDAARDAYTQEVERITRLKLSEVRAGNDKLIPKRLPASPPSVMTIAQVQQTLKELGF